MLKYTWLYNHYKINKNLHNFEWQLSFNLSRFCLCLSYGVILFELNSYCYYTEMLIKGKFEVVSNFFQSCICTISKMTSQKTCNWEVSSMGNLVADKKAANRHVSVTGSCSEMLRCPPAVTQKPHAAHISYWNPM